MVNFVYRRSKIMNLFSVMVQKRMREDKEDVEEEKSEKASKSKKSDMQLTDMDDWVVEEMDDDEDSEEDGVEDADKPAKSKSKSTSPIIPYNDWFMKSTLIGILNFNRETSEEGKGQAEGFGWWWRGRLRWWRWGRPWAELQ